MAQTSLNGDTVQVYNPATKITGQSVMLANKLGERISLGDFLLPGGTPSTALAAAQAAYAQAGGGVLYIPSSGAAGWALPSYGTPEGMSFEADGPNISANTLLGEGTGTWTWGKAWAARLPQNNAHSATAYSMTASTYGSGYPTNDQTVLAIQANKDEYNQPDVRSGGLGGLVISVYNGSPTGIQSDTYAQNYYVGVGYNSGFAVIGEDKIDEGCQGNAANCYEIDLQQGIEDNAAGTHIGEQWSADLGAHTTLFRTLGSTAGGDSSTAAFANSGVTGRWNDLILNQLDGIANFQLTDTGAIITASDGTSSTQITHSNVAGADTVTNGQKTVLYSDDQSGNFKVFGHIFLNNTDITNQLLGLAPQNFSAGLIVSGGSVLRGGMMVQDNGLFDLARESVGLAWNATQGGGEGDIVIPGSEGSQLGLSIYQTGKTNTAASAVKIWGVDGKGNEKVKGNMTAVGTIQPGTLSFSALPNPCIPGQQAYDPIALKDTEMPGAGSGAPVICTLAYRGGPLVWYSMFSGHPAAE